MKRVLSMVLALTLLCGVFALTACNGGTPAVTTAPNIGDFQGSGTQGTTAASTTPSMGSQWALANPRPGFENVTFGGHTFTFASPLNNDDGWGDYEVYAAEDGEGILDASINARNNALTEHYDCFIQVEDVALGTLTEDFNTNQNRIDLVLYKYNMQSKANGQYYNFYDLGIDLEQEWWDQGFIKDATVNGKLYTMLGSFSITSFDATWVMFFNKTVKEGNENLRGIDFYGLVEENKWTLDEFFKLVKMAAHDDGDQEMKVGTNDIFGLVSSSFGIRGLYFGADQGYVVKTTGADGTTTFAHAFSQAAVEATNKVIDIYANSATAVTDYQKVEAQMRANTVLFSPEVLRKASYYAGKQGSSTEPVQIGVLPHPKLSSDQNGYKHNVDNHVIYMCVPKTCTDLTRIAQFLEVYAYHSYHTVYNDYLKLYKYTYTTDMESADMVDEILKSRSFDLAYQYNWAAIDGEYLKGVQAGSNVISELGASFGGAIVEAANTYRDKLPND
jgi:hypothetical protein